MNSKTLKLYTGCGNIYITFVYKKEKIVKIFSNLGKSGTCASALLSSYCELISLYIESLNSVALEHLMGHQCQYSEESCINVLNKAILYELKGGKEDGT